MPDFEMEQRPSRRLWILAAAGALALHLGGAALAIARISADDSGNSLGANAIEIGIDLASPPADVIDLPPGPDVEEATASGAVAEQKAEIKPTDLPKDTPHETDDPDRVVTQNDTKKPIEHDPKVETVQAAAAKYTPAQDATAQQTLEAARESETATAPILGIGKDLQIGKAKWESKLSGYIESHTRYPKVQKGKTAIVVVSLVLNRQGHVLSVGISESSGDPLFDEAAISAIHRSEPLPPPPPGLTDEQFSYSLPMKFRAPK